MTKFIKHRGISTEKIKENSYKGLSLALNNPLYLGVEFDVRETKDKEFVLFHNPLYNGKPIKEYNYEELPKYVPLLKDILKIKSTKIFLIELKNITSFTKFIKILQKYPQKKIYVMSFSNAIINKMLIDNRPYKVGILNYVLNTNDNIKALDFVCILNNLLNENIITFLKDKEIFSYGILAKTKKYPYDNVYYIVDN